MLIVRLSAQTYKAFLPAMIANNHGHLVSIASSAGLVGVTGLAGQFLCHEFQFNVSNIFMIIFVCSHCILLVVLGFCRCHSHTQIQHQISLHRCFI